MSWINIAIFISLFILASSEKRVDVRLCYDGSGCDPHQLTCSNTTKNIVITEAFIGFNCSRTDCRRCCQNIADFQCWDVLDIVSIRVLCDRCWKKSVCRTVDLVSPSNRCNPGVHYLPVYSVVKYMCQTEHQIVKEDEEDDMCYEYQIDSFSFYPSSSDTDILISTPSVPSAEHKDNQDISLGIGITAGLIAVIVIVVVVLLFLSKRRKPTPESEELEIKDVTLYQSPYHVLESRRQSKISEAANSNRNSTYYNTVDVSIISISDRDNTHFKNIVSTKRKRLPGNRNSTWKEENASVLKNDNTIVKGDNSQSINDTDHTYDTLQITSGEMGQEISNSEFDDDDYDHLIRDSIIIARSDGNHDLKDPSR